jgi:hypothetical protein
MSQVAILSRVTVKVGKAEQYLAALAPLLEQARKEPGTLLYAAHRSAGDPEAFWTTRSTPTMPPSQPIEQPRSMPPPRRCSLN